MDLEPLRGVLALARDHPWHAAALVALWHLRRVLVLAAAGFLLPVSDAAGQRTAEAIRRFGRRRKRAGTLRGQ